MLEDGDGSGEGAEVGKVARSLMALARVTADWSVGRRCDDACMASRRVGADAAEPPVEGDQDPAVLGDGHDDVRGRDAIDAFGRNGVDVVPGCLEDRSGEGRQVLVKLDVHKRRPGLPPR